MEIVAHAGRPNPQFRANSAEALAALAATTVDRVECDIFLGSDHQLWIAHDQESVDDQTLSLDQGLELLAPLGLPIHADLKSSGQEGRIVVAHQRAGVLDRTLFCGHDLDVLARVRSLAPEAQLGWSIPQFHVDEPIVRAEALPDDLPTLVIETCRQYGINGVMSHWSLVDDALVSPLQDAGLFIHVWTVDDPTLARSLAFYPLTGLTSNDPLLIAAAIESATCSDATSSC
jgi:glycerophosphoryl diester phosphodiesterase